jgi:GH15 family glucan-1,4-alpha-glucosidase
LNRTRENFRNNERGHFVQHIGGTGLDGSMLLMPLVRFVSARDPRWLATLDAIEKTRRIRQPGTAHGQHATGADAPGVDQRGVFSGSQAQRREE